MPEPDLLVQKDGAEYTLNNANCAKSMKIVTVVPWTNTNDLSGSPSKNCANFHAFSTMCMIFSPFSYTIRMYCFDQNYVLKSHYDPADDATTDER